MLFKKLALCAGGFVLWDVLNSGEKRHEIILKIWNGRFDGNLCHVLLLRAFLVTVAQRGQLL